MADQQLVGVHHATFLVKQFSTKSKKLAFLKKLVLWYALTAFLESMVLWHHLFQFLKTFIKK